MIKKKFIITDEQINLIAGVLLELPAKNSLASIDIIRNLEALNKEKFEKVIPIEIAILVGMK